MKGLLLLSHNVEDLESLATRALLLRAGITIDTASCEDTLDIKTAFRLTVKADAFVKDIHPEDYAFLVIPGGPYVAQTIDKDTQIQSLVKTFNQSGKLIAAICAGPRFLGRASLLDSKPFTAYPGSEQDMPKGIYKPKKKVVVHDNIITARGAGVTIEFAASIVRYLMGADMAEKLLDNIKY